MKRIFKILSILFFLVFTILILLSYGITTDKFNQKIKNEITQKLPDSKLDFKDATFSLDLKSFNLKILINKPKAIIEKQEVNIKNFGIFLDLKSSIQQQYLLQNLEIQFDKNKLSKLLKTSYGSKLAVSKQINLVDGIIEGDLILSNFEENKINTNFKGKVSDTSIEFYDDLPLVKNLQSNIKLSNREINITNTKGEFANLILVSPNLDYKIDKRELKGEILLDGKLDNISRVNKILSIVFGEEIKIINNLNGKINLKSDVDLAFNEKFEAVKNKTQFTLNTSKLAFVINDPKAQYSFENVNFESKFDFNGKINAKGNFKLNQKDNSFVVTRPSLKSFYDIKLNGEVNLKETFFKNTDFFIKDDLDYILETKIQTLDNFAADAEFKLKNTEIDLSIFNYTKNKGVEANLKLKFLKNKDQVRLKNVRFKTLNDKLSVKNLYLDSEYNFKDFDQIDVNLGENNKLLIKKIKKNYIITGSNLDLRKILSERKRNKDVQFTKSINGSLKVDIKKIFLPSANLINYKNTGKVTKGEISELNSFANFEDFTTFSHEVKKNKNGNRQIVLNSEKAKPFLSNYKFLKGLEKGQLKINREVLSKDYSITEVRMNEFYLKELPILSKILSLASLTGITDTLTGKGVYFKEAYLKYELLNNELKILECYGTGPSLGFILEGRVGADEYVSLRGSLAPANTLNNIIRGVPIIGKVLTGRKGDGIFGASFSIKGKDELVSEVNPIRTITPRFLQRFLEVFKK